VTPPPSRLVSLAALLGAVGVGLGAFGAHGLKERLAGPGLELWRTAVLYHLVHAVALLAIALAERLRGRTLTAALFAAGVVIFSGTLYAMALGGPRWLGAITPLGGASFIAGWVTLAVAGLRR
jgi:uncharacterized membrane protein YgdD (TMEM256/DUF423 family)